MPICRLFTSLCFSLLMALPAHALTIDAFQDDGYVSSTSVAGTTKSAVITSTKAVGGRRTLSATKSGSGTGVTRLEVVDSSLGYTQGAHAGFASIAWDGDNDTSQIKPDGLGPIDLTQDAGTALKLGLMFFDYPSNQSVQLKVRLYDSSKPDGSKFSEISVTLNQFYSGPEVFYITLPFSMFSTAGNSTVPAPLGLTFSAATTLGAGGAVDVTKVGAISLSFRGDLNSRAPDIILGPLTTDGRCSAVPDSTGKVLDECSVCHESSDAHKGTDRCGICYAGPNGYSYTSNKIFDGCELCPGEANYQFPSGSKDKCGTCLGGPPSYVYTDIRDVCGVCGGTTTKKENCTVGVNGCPLVKPTAKILSFERSLVEKATLLKNRYQADLLRARVHRCPLSFSKANKRVADAMESITSKASEVFRQGVEVCKGSCVTVSYANEVKALTPQFKILEVEAFTAAKLVQKCYQELRVPLAPSGGNSTSRTSQTINNVRSGLDTLIRDCQRTSVCKNH